MDKIDQALNRGVDRVYPDKAALKAILSKTKIKLYQGFDPSMPSLHIGHLVGLIKLKQFQDLGHQVIFLIGDFTGMIGDPTDKKATRKKLSRKQVLNNTKKWKSQAGKILKFSGSNPVQIKFNSTWNDKISFKDLIEISANFTVQQMLERDFFQERLKKSRPIYLHEFLYPVAQAIDCVKMAVDLEIGGSDQTFNMLAGRNLMKALKKKEKYVLTTKLLVDNRGEKIGKTSGNALFLDTPANKMYGAIMSFPDEAILPGFELLTTLPQEEINQLKKDLSPVELKKRLAREIVSLIHSKSQADQAEREFEQIFQKRKLPQKANKIIIAKDVTTLLEIFKLPAFSSLASASQAKRLIRAGAVDVDNKVITDPSRKINFKKSKLIRVGKTNFFEVQSKK